MTDKPGFLLSPSGIEATFESETERIFSRSAITRIINANKEHWSLDGDKKIENPTGSGNERSIIVAKSTTLRDILEVLLRDTKLREVALDFPYRAVQRYTWGEVPAFQLIQSTDEQGYFTHFTAMHLHGLTDQIPKTVYFNVEQSATGGGGTLTQEGINRAFAGRCRVSNNIAAFGDLRICKLNGKNTAQLGVARFPLSENYDVRISNIERTLIDAVVRPVYVGGVAEVANAFRASADAVSVNKIAAYLRKLNFTYPYHQAIGYYLERAGAYSAPQIKLMERFPIQFDFHLTYQMKNPAYNDRWRLFIPKGF